MNFPYQITLEACPEIIRWAFKNKPKNFVEVIKIFEIEGSYSNLIRFLEILKLTEELKKANCLNIQEKFTETHTWFKFLSLGSELYFASEFVKLGFCASLIPDNSLEWKVNNKNISSPDFSIEKDGMKFLVEVARIKGDETTLDIANKINPVIKNYPFRVRINYSEEFSIPVVEYEERTEREQLVENFVKEFEQTIQQIDSNSLPQSKYILDCEVEFTNSQRTDGYYAGCLSGVVRNSADKIKPKIEEQLKEKAKKRKQWDDSEQKIPYLVAIDIQQDCFLKKELIPFLFGEKFDYSPDIPQYSDLEIVKEAKNNGWREFLEKVGFDPQSNVYIPQPGDIAELRPGILISNETIQKNLTGIIVKIGDRLQFAPNPFAEKEINSIELQNILPWELVMR